MSAESLVLRYICADSNNQTFVPKAPENFEQIFLTTDLLLNVSQNTLQKIHTLNCLLPFYALPCLQFSQKDNVS